MANIIIYGMGVTGQALASSLKGNRLYMYDDDASKCSLAMVDIPYDCIDMCIVCPGISDNSVLLTQLKLRGITIVGEWQYCYQLCKDTIVSVTGTNGKTTITQMIYHILQHSGQGSALLGNGGTPWSSDIGVGNRVTVLESSSFQLMRSGDFLPYISVVSNIGSDHIDYHGSMDSYISAKCNNFVNQGQGQYAIFNMDDKQCVKLATRCNSNILYYSLDNSNSHCYMAGGDVVCNIAEQSRCSAGIINSFHKHDQGNALSAILTCKLIGIDIISSVTALQSYIVAPHKVQTILMHNGITYIDDSKSTNISATLCAVDSVSGDIALILGGSGKGYGFDQLIANLPSRVVAIAVMGDVSKDIASSCAKYNRSWQMCIDMQQAVEYCISQLHDGGTVLLSPACASFDRYSNYAERGRHFDSIVRGLVQC